MSKFRLQPVLKLRQYAEELRKRELAAALAEEQQRKDAVLRLAHCRQEQIEQLRHRQQQADLDVRSLIEHRQYVGVLEREIHLRLREVAVAEHQTRGRQEAVAEAMRRRKAIDVVRQRFDSRVRRQADRLETLEMDEFAAIGHGAQLRSGQEGQP